MNSPDLCTQDKGCICISRGQLKLILLITCCTGGRTLCPISSSGLIEIYLDIFCLPLAKKVLTSTTLLGKILRRNVLLRYRQQWRGFACSLLRCRAGDVNALCLQNFNGLKNQDLQHQKDQLVVETSDMLHLSLFTAEALLRTFGKNAKRFFLRSRVVVTAF